MLRWIVVTLFLSACGVAAVWMLAPHLNSGTASAGSYSDAAEPKKPDGPSSDQAPRQERVVIKSSAGRGQPEVVVYQGNGTSQVVSEPIVIPDGTLTIVQKQEVASEKEGVLKYIGTLVGMGEEVPPDRELPQATLGFLALQLGPKPVEGKACFQHSDQLFYRRIEEETDTLEPNKVFLFRERRTVQKLKVGDSVKKGQLLAQVNPAKSYDDVSVKRAKLNAVEYQRNAAEKQRNEFKRRWDNYQAINRATPRAIPEDTLQETHMQWVKYYAEELVKRAEIVEAQCTLNAAATDMKMHSIYAEIDGVIRAIYKNHQGDAVKPDEAIMRIENATRLRAEGRLELQEALKLEKGMKVIIEASRPEAPKFVISGHLGPVNCVAVTSGKKPIIVSGSDDDTLRGWDAETGERLWHVFIPRTSIRSVACSPAGSKHNYVCFGCSDGSVRLLDLDGSGDKKLQVREMSERHHGPVLGIAFSPNGERIATCADDRPPVIRMWNTEGALLHTLAKHSGAVTSVQFASAERLVSAGRDGRLVVWDVAEGRPPRSVGQSFEGRTGEVQTIGVSPDGKTVLFDQGKELRLLTLDEQQIVGTLMNPSEHMNFSTMALFAPDGKTILTNGSAPGKLQLWRTPVTQKRGSELRQFIWNTPTGTVTCGAFAPDSSFAVTGTQDHKVLVWAMPSKEEIDHRLEAELCLVEKYLDTQSRHVRVWAELENPGWLIPGMHTTMVVLPPRK